jgi:hypothetical protein
VADPVSGSVPYIVVDRVHYGTKNPWPESPDGQGPSLTRLVNSQYGNDAVNWFAGPNGGTPGVASISQNISGTAGNDEFYLRLDSGGTKIQVFTAPDPSGQPAYEFPIAGGVIAIDSLGGDDRLKIDLANGNPIPAGGLLYRGGGQSSATGDRLEILGTGSQSLTYLPSGSASGSGSLSIGGKNLSFTGLEPITVSGLASVSLVTPNGSDTLSIDTPAAGQSRISGTSGDISFESLTFFNTGSVTIDTAANDSEDSRDDVITVGSAGLTASGLSTLVINSGQGNNSFIINGGFAALGPAGAGNGNLAITANNDSVVNLAGNQVLAGLTLNGTSNVNLPADGNHVLRVGALSMSPQATLDLADNDLIVQADAATRDAVLAMVTQLISSARNTTPELWSGKGITSSAAAADGSKITGLAVSLNQNGSGGSPQPTFDGQPVNANSILVKYTYNGDGDLSGAVDADDYSRIDFGFALGQNGYTHGDFDLNGVVDADDYSLIDIAFATQAEPLATSGPTALATRSDLPNRPIRAKSRSRRRHHRMHRA